MTATVTLTVTAGKSAGQTYEYTERTTCLIGRADDCDPRIGDLQVSRHHCLLDVNPPDVRIRDFGSLNGTFVNDTEIGRRRKDQTPEQGARLFHREQDLKDGDQVRLGTGTTLRISVCSAASSAEQAPARCGQCGRDVAAEVGARRGGFVCAACKRDPRAVVAALLRKAAEGNPAVAPVRGYSVVRELGRGGQGVVYLAEHHGSGRLMALKMLLAEVAVEERARNGFLREIESTRVLRHVNVVELLDSGSTDGTFFFASEFCDGGSVTDLLRDAGRRLPIDEAVEITAQALTGLAYAHAVPVPGVRRADGKVEASRGLVHRDIKPSNILLAGTGARATVKLADFGLAKAFDGAGLSGHTRTGSVGGTVAYMSRQQILDYKFAKPEVDVWAMAATLYHMLTGSTPRDFPPHKDPITVVLREPAIPIREREPSVPRRLAAVVDAALVDTPRIAVTSADEFRTALIDAL
jgi:eukaryotic-like serine/threonine-protein kinase